MDEVCRVISDYLERFRSISVNFIAWKEPLTKQQVLRHGLSHLHLRYERRSRGVVFFREELTDIISSLDLDVR